MYGHIHVVAAVLSNDREDTVRAADGGTSGIVIILDNRQAWFAMRVPHVGVVHQVVGDSAYQWKQKIFGIFELPIGVSAGKHLAVNSPGMSFVSVYK